MKCTISGSFRKFYKNILEAIDSFEQAGIAILSPAKSKIVNPDAKFVVFESDDAKLGIKDLEEKHFKAIENSDFLYILNPPYEDNPYIGNSAVMEIGFAIARNKPIYCLNPIDDQTLNAFVKGIFDSKDLANLTGNNLNIKAINAIAKPNEIA